jgi:hypothetical protein
LKRNIIGIFQLVEDFHLLNRDCYRKTSKQSKISIGNVGKNRICPSQMLKLLSITLIVWSGAIRCGRCIFPSILVTVREHFVWSASCVCWSNTSPLPPPFWTWQKFLHMGTLIFLHKYRRACALDQKENNKMDGQGCS